MNTPCWPSANPDHEVWFKLESCNPTGSYKDRFLDAEMRRIRASGARVVLATSSGNTGAALAAYSARAGVRAIILASPEAPPGKVAQMRAHGATVVRVPGFSADPVITTRVMDTLARVGEAKGWPLVVSAFRYCPEGMAGVSSIAAELAPLVPRHVFVPVGGGGLYTAVVRGFRALALDVKVHAVQPEGCATVVDAWASGSQAAVPAGEGTSISGLSVPVDIDATLALGELRANGGRGIAVSDAAILRTQRHLLAREGIFCEPAGAAAAAGWGVAVERGWISRQERSICLVTGHGGKDPASIDAAASEVESPLLSGGELEEWLRHV